MSSKIPHFNRLVPESLICVGSRLRQIGAFRPLRRDCTSVRAQSFKSSLTLSSRKMFNFLPQNAQRLVKNCNANDAIVKCFINNTNYINRSIADIGKNNLWLLEDFNHMMDIQQSEAQGPENFSQKRPQSLGVPYNSKFCSRILNINSTTGRV